MDFTTGGGLFPCPFAMGGALTPLQRFYVPGRPGGASATNR
ncbi:hypothetical protein KNP414_03461 [Paenibacillus mucilaginosus KNP414]|uniref:Uncharacterized protein n=1 Tax=Paenibacillus mucilaginosus (strain KNP414) TaxID=1036673 RepID=F8F8V7_PAEMK|nr:hypothetical protein KNP414_03461 [Paenibacillus mucilaginosus KNP414]